MLGCYLIILNVQGCSKPFLENLSAVIELRLPLAYSQCSRCHKLILGCHWPLFIVQDVLYAEPNLKMLSLSFVNDQAANALSSNCASCHWPILRMFRLSLADLQSRCHKPILEMFRLSLSFVNVQRLPISCLQIAQAVINLFSECSGCHWRILNQDVINLFSKCSGCHWPLA